jgi:deoxyribose-phosphate aldolase
MIQYVQKEGIFMEIKEILTHVDHTLLKQEATWEQIKKICDDGIKFNTASICIPPSYVKECADYCQGKISVCTVIGFPNGYNTTACKVFEAADAVENGADEIDMVINIGWLKDKRYDLIENEIREIKKACNGKILKVIIETCLLTDEEKIKMCSIVTDAGADFIKTSTGFSTAGATFDDIKLFSENIGGNVKMKAAGGIASIDDAEKFLSLGAERLGTSRVVSIAKSEQGSGY